MNFDKNRKIAVLFAMENSVYNNFSNVELYDEKRNALKFAGGMPVIAHPPCRLFSKLRGFSKAPIQEKQLAYFAVDAIQRNGGVLEHPFPSKLWDEAGLPKTGLDKFGGFTLRLFQYQFGHRAAKDTMLYIVGISPQNLPAIPVRIGIPNFIVTTCKEYKQNKEISKRERHATPYKFAEWLISVARSTKTGVSDHPLKPAKQQSKPFGMRSELKPYPLAR